MGVFSWRPKFLEVRMLINYLSTAFHSFMLLFYLFYQIILSIINYHYPSIPQNAKCFSQNGAVNAELATFSVLTSPWRS